MSPTRPAGRPARTLMLNFRAPWFRKGLVALGGRLHRRGVSPNAITVVGTLGSVASATLLLGTGRFFVGALAITAFVLLDLLDGAVARAGGTSSKFGAILDSTLDRVADASIFGALIWFYAGPADRRDLVLAALLALVLGQLVPYVRARAGGLGIDAKVGIAERAVRLTVVLIGVGLAGLGLPLALPIALWLLVAAGLVTVVQRLDAVRTASARG